MTSLQSMLWSAHTRHLIISIVASAARISRGFPEKPSPATH